MVNKNGSNNGVHKDTAIVARNGNGAHNDPAIIDEHELLWDGLSPAVTNALGQPIDPALVSQRKGRAGRTFSYIEGHVAISEANRVFGYGGWGYELLADVTLREIENVDTQTGEVKRIRAYSAPVRVTVPGAPPRIDVGFHAVTEETADGHETALKGAAPQLWRPLWERPLRRPGSGRRPAPTGPGARPGQGGVRPGECGDAAQAARRAGRRAGLRRGPGADRRGGPAGQEPGRPDGGGADASHRGGDREAPADAAGAGGLVRPAHRETQSSGVVSSRAAPLLIYRNRRTRPMTTMHTPWGPPQDIEELAEGVWRVSTASHGGLKLSRERWAEIPAAVRRTLFTPTFAEEDCEEPIVRTLLGLGDDREREMAVRVAEHFECYAPALPYLREKGGAR